MPVHLSLIAVYHSNRRDASGFWGGGGEKEDFRGNCLLTYSPQLEKIAICFSNPAVRNK